MTVQAGDTFKRYVANGVATVYAIPFLLLDAADLVVTLDDVVVSSGFTLTGVGNPSSTATFSVAPSGDLLFRLVVPFQRLFDYQENGDFLSETVNADFDRIWLALKELRRFDDRALKVSDLDPEGLPDLPSVSERVGKLLSFDSFGNPIAVAGDSQSATELSLLLAASDGSNLVGHGSSTVGEVLDQLGYVESFGLVNTPEAAFVTWQAAINWCAANNVVLRAMAAEYTIDFSVESLTIPDNFRCKLPGVTIKRATGNTTPHDMWVNADIVAGNTGIYIEGVTFDGQRQADSLSNATPAHRFAGLRLVNCAAGVVNVRADNTVNAEVASDTGGPTRAGIVLFDSQLVICRELFADGTNGTGFIAENGLVSVDGAWFYNNTGSGLSVRNCAGSYFNNCNNDTSGYSGLSFNAANLRISNISSINSPLGYAGINIGHSSVPSQAPNCVAVNLSVSNCLGWGIFVNYANNLLGANWTVADSITRGVHIVDSLKVRVMNLKSRNAAANDLLVTGASSAWVDVDFQGSQSSGAQASGTASIEFSATSIISDPCQSASGTIAGILANAGTYIRYPGAIVDSDRYGVISSGAGAIVDLAGARVTGSAIGPTLASSGGVINYSNSKFSATDHTSGNFTIAAAASSAVVNNGNAIDGQRIVFTPTNSEARLGAVPIVTAVVAGTSFTASIGSATTNARTYSYVLL